MYRINEIFYTLQGEGAHSGIPAVFVRFSGCNLRCPWCDTEFAEYTEMSAEQIIAEMQALYDVPNQRRKMCVLTGGEPSLQIDKALTDALHAADFYICVETNGTHPLPDDIDWITCSPKEGSKLALKRANEVKVVFTGTYDPEIWRSQLEAEHWMLQPLRYTGEWLLMSETLDNTNWVPVYIVVYEVVAILQVLTFRNTVGCNKHLYLSIYVRINRIFFF